MKIAIVGVGGMGTVHFNIYKKLESIDFAAACDIRLDMLKEKAGENSPIRLYADYEEMLKKEKPDIVDICTPTYLHADQAVLAMEYGAHVLSEKPMGLCTADCDKILAAMNKTGKRYMTAQVVRFMNAYVYLRNTIQSKKYGRLESLTMRRFGRMPRWKWNDWMKDKRLSGHVTMDVMLHDVDFVQSVLGDPLSINGVYKEMKDNTNYAFVNFTYPDCAVSMETGWYNADISFTADFKAVFENGYLSFNDQKQLLDCGEIVEFDKTGVIAETGINLSNVDGFDTEILHFIDCVEKDQLSPIVPPESSAKTIALMEKISGALTKL